MENLYSDVLLFLYHLSLAILVGGGIVLGSAVAPGIFRTVSSRGEAGTIFGAALARWDGLAILCVIVIVITSALRFGVEVVGLPEPRLIARWLALAVMSAGVIFGSGWANPVARSLRAQTPAFDDLPESTPVRREFAALHRRSSTAMRVAVFAGLVAMFLS